MKHQLIKGAVIEAAWTVSGKMICILQLDPASVETGARLLSDSGHRWTITSKQTSISRQSDDMLAMHLKGRPWVLVTLAPVEHNQLPTVTESLVLLAGDH